MTVSNLTAPEADLRGADFRGARLHDVRLTGANLHGADSRDSTISDSYLDGADLSDGNFTSEKLPRSVHVLGGGRVHTQVADYRPGARLNRVVLQGTNLTGANLAATDLFGCNLSRAILHRAVLCRAQMPETQMDMADVSDANLDEANMTGVSLKGARLCRSSLRNTVLVRADMSRLETTNLRADMTVGSIEVVATDLSDATLEGADLRNAILVGTNLAGAKIGRCSVYGISAWHVNLDGADQSDLLLTPPWEAPITTDRLDLAQFICLLIDNKNIRQFIDAVTSKCVLILGRFTPERRLVLEQVRGNLRRHGYVPVIFAFEGPRSRDGTETISTLAQLARFVIADLSSPRSVPHELATILSALRSAPLVPIIASDQNEYSLFDDFRSYPSVLEVYRYTDEISLGREFADRIIAPVERWLALRRRSAPPG
jgi:uncharacterized protein YjbI with pentapeptide repeats